MNGISRSAAVAKAREERINELLNQGLKYPEALAKVRTEFKH